MAGALDKVMAAILRPPSITGPIFAKELRCSGRRKRHYVLRTVYIALLLLLLVLFWLAEVERRSYYGSSAAYRISRMAEAGKIIIITVIWFQFVATQLVAVVLASTSISDEIHHRTLGVLMTTPINSLQIVLGKLFSRLLMLLMLLGVSVPVLAIVRVFGGVPWDFVLAGLCVTFTAMLFAAAVSLFMSIFCRRAYAVILLTLLAGGLLYGLLPLLVGYTMDEVFNSSESEILSVLTPANPILVMFMETAAMISPWRMGALWASWPWHCAIMLGATVFLLLLGARLVRKAALAQAAGPSEPALPRSRLGRILKSDLLPRGKIRRVFGSPLIWKEIRNPLFRSWRGRLIVALLTVLILVPSYGVCARDLDDNDTHIIFLLIYTLLGALVTTVLSATSITSEKETRTWPILLVTPLTDWQIMKGKMAGVFRRCLPVWLLPFGHVAVFSAVGYCHPVLLLHYGMLAFWLLTFLAGTGLFFGSLCRRTTGAVVLNLVMVAGLWIGIPAVGALALEAMDVYRGDVFYSMLDTNPAVQAVVITEEVAGKYQARQSLRAMNYSWPAGGERFGPTTHIMLVSMVFYGGVGILLAWLGSRRLRKGVF